MIWSGTHEHAAGAAVGGTLGFVKGLMLISMVSWGAILDTAILSGVGTLVGLMISALYKKIFNSKKTP